MEKNIIANIVGKFWSIASGFIFIPIYIKFLGIQGYSLVSFSLVLLGLIAILDSGLSATLSREFAQSNYSNDKKNRILRTLESCYFLVTSVLILSFLLFANIIVDKWLNIEGINHQTAVFSIRIIGVGISFQLLLRFYIGGLLGLEKQILANILQVSWGILRNGLVILIFIFSTNLVYFFLWQSISTIVFVLLIRYRLLYSLNKFDFFTIPKIEIVVLKKVGKFAFGIFMIIVVASLNTQFDKLIISKLLAIENLGYYTLAVSLATSITAVVNPISVATLPRLTSLYSEGRSDAAVRLYHRITSFVVVIVFSIAAVLVFCSSSIIYVWTGDKILAQNSSIFLPFLAFGGAMLALQYIPFNIAVANGYTKINNILGISSLFVTMPGYYFAVKEFGSIGAAIVYAFSQTIITLLYLFFIGKKFLHGHYFTIFFKELLIPATISFVSCWLVSNWFLGDIGRWEMLLRVLLISFVVLMISGLVVLPIKRISKIKKYI